MIKYAFLSLAIIFTSLGSYLYFYLGFSEEVKIQVVSLDPRKVIGKEHIGAYFKISEVISQVEKSAKNLGIPCEKTLGWYFDDPRAVDEDRLRSFAACLIEKELSSEMKALVQNENLELRILKGGKHLQGIFKGSPAITPFKVYPKLEAWMSENRTQVAWQSIEIYHSGPEGFWTETLLPLEEQ